MENIKNNIILLAIKMGRLPETKSLEASRYIYINGDNAPATAKGKRCWVSDCKVAQT